MTGIPRNPAGGPAAALRHYDPAVDPLPAPPDDAQSRDLVERARAGDSAAGEEFYRRYHDEILFAVRARLGARLRGVLQSEDVLQSVALEALQALPRFEHGGPGSVRRWLQRIVLNKVRDLADHWSAQKRDLAALRGESALVLAENVAQAEPGYHDERFFKLERALAALPEDMRTILVLRRAEGLTSREAAERMGRSDDSARKLYSRALARLTTSMGHERGTT